MISKTYGFSLETCSSAFTTPESYTRTSEVGIGVGAEGFEPPTLCL